jgi:hypothetical protein
LGYLASLITQFFLVFTQLFLYSKLDFDYSFTKIVSFQQLLFVFDCSVTVPSFLLELFFLDQAFLRSSFVEVLVDISPLNFANFFDDHFFCF